MWRAHWSRVSARGGATISHRAPDSREARKIAAPGRRRRAAVGYWSMRYTVAAMSEATPVTPAARTTGPDGGRDNGRERATATTAALLRGGKTAARAHPTANRQRSERVCTWASSASVAAPQSRRPSGSVALAAAGSRVGESIMEDETVRSTRHAHSNPTATIQGVAIAGDACMVGDVGQASRMHMPVGVFLEIDVNGLDIVQKAATCS